MARILDVIQYADTAGTEIVHRIPEAGAGDFRIGSQVVVREGQSAVFFRDGRALDTFAPGRHTITTANIPLLVGLVRTVFSGATPFTAECYFVSTRDFIDMRWGTSEPITLRDEVLRMVRVRAHGSYSMAVTDPQMFVAQIVGARGCFTTQDVADYLRGMIVSRFTDLLGETMKSVLDLPAMFEEISAATRAKMHDDFSALGLALKRFYIMSVSPTDETSKAIDEAASMGAVGDMDRYMKFKTARAVGDAAQTEGGGGTAQMGVGLGAAIAAARIMSDSFGSAQAQAAPPAATPAPADPMGALKTLKDLLDAGLITAQEYDAKRTEILKRL